MYDQIRTLIENGVKSRHRSMFVIVGDDYHELIEDLHQKLSNASVKWRRTALWCYKDKLDTSSHKKKHQRQIKRDIHGGTLDPASHKKKRQNQIKRGVHVGALDPEKTVSCASFLEGVGLTYCCYKDSERILGNTFGMCILQDFEALTPNLLARTIETVEGGGLVLLLLRSLSQLKSLYTMVMDVHEKFRKESHSLATSCFNERFLLSLGSCKACVVMDDKHNILPISSHMRSITPVEVAKDSEWLSKGESDLRSLKEQLLGDFPVGPLLEKCCTLDQGQAVMTFLDAILDKALRSTVALISGRGRGKSAALGLAVAGAVAAGYSNIYVTAPSPDNLKTLFEFVCKGFDALGYKEHLNYDIVKSNNPDFKKATTRINIYKQHRQTIQYIEPNGHEKLSQVELLVVDEAAAIPLPVVKSLLGSYLVFLSSTVNGYEGTGRSLSLKLLQQLEDQSKMSANSSNVGRTFIKVELNESIRYAAGDPIESWLHGLLCLDATSSVPNINRFPLPSECDLYYVNRDTLFSYHKDSETFLQRMMALYVSSHYKNSPNDLQMMADAPAHHLFVLLGPVDESKNRLPDILCVLQVCLEGQISRESVIKSLSEGHQPYGDQIPWKFSEQFQDTVFPSLSGARIVRIAVHPNAMRLGYGSAAIQLLIRYYEGQLTHITETDIEIVEDKPRLKMIEAAEDVSLLEENIKPRANLPPLLVHLGERQPEKLHYIGVSFGLTLDLFNFWRKHKFAPFYICQIPNAVTGEHTCMVLRPLNNEEIEGDRSKELGFFSPFYLDFRRRFARLLGSCFRHMWYELVMRVLDPMTNFMEQEPTVENGFLKSPKDILSPYDMKRLEAYTNQLSDYHTILDLVPKLADQYFQGRIPVTLSSLQASILLCIGLQEQDFTYFEGQLKEVDRKTIQSSFYKVMTKLYKYMYTLASSEITSVLPRLRDVVMKEHSVSVDDDLNEAAKQLQAKMKEQLEGTLNPELLQRYAVVDREADFENALQNGKISGSGLISVKSNKSSIEKHSKHKDKSNSNRRRDTDRSKSNKRRKS